MTRSVDLERDPVVADAVEQHEAAHAQIGEGLAHHLARRAHATRGRWDVDGAPLAGVAQHTSEQDTTDCGVAHDVEDPTREALAHLSDSSSARAAILALLERHSSRCLDDEADREALADAIAAELQLDVDDTTDTDRRE